MSEPAATLPSFSKRELVRVLWRLGLALLVLFAAVGVISQLFRPQLEALGKEFVERYGYWGMAFGTFLSDGLHVPIPPPFYILLAISSNSPFVASILAISAGSLLGSVFAYQVARWVSRFPWLARKLEPSRLWAEKALSRFGDKGALWVSLLPIPYSSLCYLTGLGGLPWRFIALVCLWRLPRLLLYYALVRFGWYSLG